MKFFLDTANLEEIKKIKSIGMLDGITTNPSLISKENIYNENDVKKHYISICKLLDEGKYLSVEVISTDYHNIINEAKKLSILDPNKIVIKVPMTIDGIKSIQFFSKKKIKTNCTLIFSVGQALLAAKSGAYYISPFLGRLDDISYNGLKLIEEIKKVFFNFNFKTKILAASIRNPIHIIECAKIGIHAITTPINTIYSLFNHPMTNIGLNKFLEDYKKKIK
ncbi:fructose-6-phosphate aldolase [Blattabacterium cuenoti]|uniref:fructose-6-phosphate aldolase n=1 Tax=Blattabacterium cuenoti TaxID=1653831 RepID=UPI00163C8C6E|nr:fructose-6-phosphate aldolase [Blattabacterium cuenoti]